MRTLYQNLASALHFLFNNLQTSLRRFDKRNEPQVNFMPIAEQKEIDFTEQMEQEVRKYFEQRNCVVQKLDTKSKIESADFHISNDNISFLCEVKTILSSRADFPTSPVADNIVQERDRRKKELEEYIAANPNAQVVMPKSEYDFLNAPDEEIRSQYRNVKRNTQAGFEGFTARLREYLSQSQIAHLPYQLRIDSDNLYFPGKPEANEFFAWLENQIETISQGTIGINWEMARYSDSTFFFAVYRFKNGNECSLTISTPSGSGQFELAPHFYGTLNLGTISSNLAKATKQLKSTSTELDLAHLIALHVDVTFFHEEFAMLKDLLCEHLLDNPSVTAIALLRNLPETRYDGNDPTEELNHFFNLNTTWNYEMFLFCRDKATNSLAQSGLFEYIVDCLSSPNDEAKNE